MEKGDIKGLRKAQQPRKPTIKKNVKKKAPVKIEMKRQVTGREVKLNPQRQQALSKAVKTAIPQNTKINTVVTAVIRPNRSKPSVVVSHLMDGESPDDVDSTVRPEYNTIPKLSSYSQKRAYDILKSILQKVDTKGVSELVIEVNHGVRETNYINGKDMGQSALVQNWKVEHNHIPFLTISGRDD